MLPMEILDHKQVKFDGIVAYAYSQVDSKINLMQGEEGRKGQKYLEGGKGKMILPDTIFRRD